MVSGVSLQSVKLKKKSLPWCTLGADQHVGLFPRAEQKGKNGMPIIRKTLDEIIKSKPKADWERIRNTTDEEIDAMIAADPDTAPDMSDIDWRNVVTPKVPDVRALRRKLGLSQAQFASKFGFNLRTLQEWEQGRALPDRPARILLRVIEKSPRSSNAPSPRANRSGNRTERDGNRKAFPG